MLWNYEQNNVWSGGTVSGILISDIRCYIPTFRATESRKRNLTEMPRLFNMMDYLQPCSHLQCKTGWTKCLLYQKGIDEELSCTTEAKPIITGAGGNTLADTLLGFCKIDYLPKLNCRCGPHGRWWWRAYFIFKRNSVKWHDSCRQSLTAPSFVEQRRWKHHVRTLQWCSRSTPGRV